MRPSIGVSASGVALALVAAFGSALGACQEAPVAAEHVCAGALAISTGHLTGTSLPPKTLALTFDDGPGARTSELSTFLKNRGIAAGFFLNGKMIHDTAVLAQLVADGHVIGNHTQTHASLTGQSTGSWHLDDAATVSELAQTDVLIAPFVTADRFMFRAPYGDYDWGSAAAINASAMKKYVGDVHWDIGDHMGSHQAADWDCWVPGHDGVVLTVTRCAQLYLEEIDNVGRGVVLMHDPYSIGGNPANGGTVDMVEAIVPILESKGYTFVRIDQVPDIDAALPPLPPPPPPAEPGPGARGDVAGPRVGGARTRDGWATTPGTAGANGAGGPANGSPVAPNAADPGPPAGAPLESASASGGKPDPCASSPQRKAAK